MPLPFGKKYKLASSENFDEYKKTLGASLVASNENFDEYKKALGASLVASNENFDEYKKALGASLVASNENFDEYMKALGVDLVTRKMGNAVSPVMELIEEEDGQLTLKSTSTFKNSSITFKLGEEFPEETHDGRHVKSIITQEGNKLIQVQKGHKETIIEREFTPEEVKVTVRVDDIVCVRLTTSALE